VTRKLSLLLSWLDVEVIGELGTEQRDSMRSGEALKRVQ